MNQSEQTEPQNNNQPAGWWRWLNLRADIQILFVFALLVFGLFANSLNNQFAYDDHVLIEANTGLRSWSYFTTAFTDSHSYDVSWVNLKNSSLDYYRPFTRMLFALAFQAFELKTIYWHLLNVAIFTVVVMLAYAVLKQMTLERATAILGTLLFAVHPIHSEAVAWVNCLVETLHALFFLSAFALYLRAHAQGVMGAGRIFFLGSLTLTAAGLLSKETSLALPILVAAYNFIYTESNIFRRFWAGVKAAIPFLLVVAGYFILRYFAYGGTLKIVSRIPMSTVLLTIPRVILEYFTMLIVPIKLSPVHYVEYVTNPLSYRFWLPLLVLIALTTVIVFYASRRVQFACAWILITMLPVLNIGVFTYELLLQDRYAFLPSLGFCALIAIGLSNIFQRQGLWVKLRPVMIAVTVMALIALSLLTLRQNKFWYSDRTIFGRATAMNPGSEFARCNYGFALANEDENEEAARQFSEAIKLTRAETGLESGCGCLGMGNYYADKKDFRQAIPFYERAMDLGEGSYNLLIYNYLGYAYDQVGDSKKAIALLEDVLTRHPDFQEAHFTLSQVLLRMGNIEAGLRALTQAIELNPQDANARLLLAQVLEGRGLRKQAAEQYRIVLTISPELEMARTRLNALENNQ